MERYDVYHPDLIRLLFRDEIEENHWLGQSEQESHEVFFVNFVNYNYNRLAKPYGCTIRVHARRSIDALDIWLDDCERALKKLHTSTEIDEFKTAGFLAYWLRRRCVVDEVKLSGPRDLAAVPDNLQSEFIRYANEICAFVLGFHFCLKYQLKSREEAKAVRLDPAYIRECAAYMSTKNVSPHSLYLIYRSLFTGIRRV